jgi:hypothetical protein
LASSGLHSNGYSLVRKIVADSKLDYKKSVPEFGSRSLGEVLLEPTMLYTGILNQLLESELSNSVHALSHITGGGIAANLSRVLPAGVALEVERSSWAPDNVFRVLAEWGAYSLESLEGTWNLGLGFAAVVSADKATEVAKLTQQRTRLADEIQKLTKLPMVYAGNFSQPGPTNRMHRGDPTQPREIVAPASLKQIGQPLTLPADTPEQERRLALADWIADPANPLTARVIVNRLWHYHFGTGLIETPSDFGINGARPTHPELLDFLASELIAHKWSLKHIHKLILMSKTFQQSSAMHEVAYKADSNARLLWRFPPRRLEAEAVRDAMLVTSGQLDLKMGGPGFDLFEPNDNYVKVYQTKTDYGPAEFRRMVYQSKPRTMLDDFFGAFDCPDAGQPAPKRTSSTTPLQALNLLNSHFAMQQAEAFANRVTKESGPDVPKQVHRAFELIFQRPPTHEEQNDAIALAKSHGLPALCRALFNSNEFIRLN